MRQVWVYEFKLSEKRRRGHNGAGYERKLVLGFGVHLEWIKENGARGWVGLQTLMQV